MRISDKVRARRNTIDDVWKKVDRSGGPDACWPWTGAIGQGGYGQWGLTTDASKRQGRAHRFAYEATWGPFSPELVVCHSCDVRLCCNPAHLFLGTMQDNNEDMWAKGRGKADTHGAEHGTYSGYTRHITEAGGWTKPACEACREAKRLYQRAHPRPYKGRSSRPAEANPDGASQPTSVSRDEVSRDSGTARSTDLGPDT